MLSNSQLQAVLSVLGGLLAAYGFFYNSVRDRLSGARDLKPSAVKSDRAYDAKKLDFPVRISRALAAAAWTVVLTFAVTTVQVIRDSWSEMFGDGGYNPIRAGLVLLEVFWLAVAIATTWQSHGLAAKRRKLRDDGS